MKRKKRFADAGFTLVELVVAIAIIAILAGIALPRFLEALEASRQATDLDNARTAESLATVKYVSDSESGTVNYYFDRDTGRILKASEVSSISGYGLSEIETSTTEQETIYNTNDITNISGTPKSSGVSGIVRIEINPTATDRKYDIHAYWQPGITGGVNGYNGSSIAQAVTAAATSAELIAALTQNPWTNNNEERMYGYAFVTSQGLVVSSQEMATALVSAGLVPDNGFYTIKTDGKTEYMYDGITCSGTDDYDCYQINFRNVNGAIAITANAKKGGKKGTDATEKFCADTGLTADTKNYIGWHWQ